MLKKVELAGTELANLLKKNPVHPRANHLMAMGILDQNELDHARLDEAEGFLIKAEQGYDKERFDDFSELYTDWGNLHYERGDTIKAILYWRRALQMFPQNEVAAKNLEQFDDVRFSEAATVNEMAALAKHPAQLLAHLARFQNFKNQEEAQDFANEIFSLWRAMRRLTVP